MKFEFRGVISAMITPLKNSGREIDEKALRTYCDFLISKGVKGLFICGTTGEGPLMSVEERKRISEIIVDQVKNRAKVIINSGYITTDDTIALIKHSQKIGADAAAVVLPYYYSLDDRSLIDHFIKIARTVPELPFFIYNIPENTINNFVPHILEEIFEKVDNFAGIKTSNADLLQLQEYIDLLHGEIPIYYGNDKLNVPALAMGAAGIISGNASVFPEPFIKLYKNFKEGELEKARQQQAFNYKMATILKDGKYPAVYKKSLELLGINVGNVRPPHRELLPDEVEHLTRSLKELELVN